MYYINDGVYGSFNCVLYDHYVPEPCLFAKVCPARALERVIHVDESRTNPAKRSRRRSGARLAMVSIAFKRRSRCPSWTSKNGCTGRTWARTQSLPPYNSMAFHLASPSTSCPSSSGRQCRSPREQTYAHLFGCFAGIRLSMRSSQLPESLLSILNSFD